MVAARDADSVVVMVSLMNKNISQKEPGLSQNAAFMATRLFRGMPIRWSAIHFGYNSEMWVPVDSAVKLSSLDANRIRCRTFQGERNKR